MNRTLKNIITISIILLVVFLFIYPKLNLFGPTEAPAGGPPMGGGGSSSMGSELPVNAMVVTQRQMDNKIRVTGTVQPNESLELRSEIAGIVTKIHFREGQRVRKGDLLISLNDEELQAQLEKLKFSLKLYQDNEFRQRQLLDREAISREEYERSLTELNTSQADIKLVEVQIARTKIRASFDGIIGLRSISEGGYVTSATNLVSLYSINPAKIDFSVPGRYSTLINPGDKILFTVDGTEERFSGEVYAVEPQIDPSTRTLRLRALSNNDRGILLPGQFARIELILESIPDAIMLPSISITPQESKQLVYLVKDNQASPREVILGIRTDNEVQILSGISPGDTVITSGLMQVRPGQKLKITSLN
jgi:membrane fusion protein, multidrug efflux system